MDTGRNSHRSSSSWKSIANNEDVSGALDETAAHSWTHRCGHIVGMGYTIDTGRETPFSQVEDTLHTGRETISTQVGRHHGHI